MPSFANLNPRKFILSEKNPPFRAKMKRVLSEDQRTTASRPWRSIFVLIGVLFVFALTKNYNQKNPPLKQFFEGAKNLEASPSPTANANVENIFTNEIPNLSGNWAVVAKDLKTNQTYNYSENKIFAAASLYKLATMWAVYEAQEKGNLEKSASVSAQLDAMITVSDNDSAVALSETLGWTSIEKLMKSEGLGGFDMTGEGAPYTTAKSTADLLERIYRKTAVNASASATMQELLFDQQINDRIPKYLPKGVEVGHKTGEIDNFRHDAGIVMGKNSHYIFVFLSETSIPQDGSEKIAKLSKKLFDTLEGR